MHASCFKNLSPYFCGHARVRGHVEADFGGVHEGAHSGSWVEVALGVSDSNSNQSRGGCDTHHPDSIRSCPHTASTPTDAAKQ